MVGKTDGEGQEGDQNRHNLIFHQLCVGLLGMLLPAHKW